MISKNSSRVVSLVILIMLFAVGIVIWIVKPGTTTSQPLEQRAYVWQRVQTAPEVASAIDSLPDFVSGLLPLVAEIHYRDGADAPPEIVRPSLAVASFQKRAEAKADAGVIRIGMSAKDTQWNPKACQLVESVARETMESRIWIPSELQIDYDCPQKKLADYRKLLRHLRAAFPSTRLTFTALPSWLGEPEFPSLAKVCDSYVLQVHSLQLPDDESKPVVLINPDAARRAVEAAGKLRHPFEVALPTYSCFVVFETDGKDVFDVVSEDIPNRWPADKGRIKLGRTDPAEIAGLVRDWVSARPKAMTGVVWYRLPVETDVMNWSRSTWMKVARGEQTAPHLIIESVRLPKNPDRTSLLLRNMGDAGGLLPTRINLSVSGEGEYRWDAGRLYLGKGDPLTFELKSGPVDHLPLPPGESVSIGWVEGDVTVTATIQP